MSMADDAKLLEPAYPYDSVPGRRDAMMMQNAYQPQVFITKKHCSHHTEYVSSCIKCVFEGSKS